MIKNLYEWVREGESLSEIYSKSSTPGDYMLSGRRVYVGVSHKPHQIRVHDWPITLIDGCAVGFYSSDFGLKWEFGEGDNLKRVIYKPGGVEYHRIYEWLEIKQVLFVPIDEEGFIQTITLRNTERIDKKMSLFVEPIFHLQYYSPTCAPSGTFWQLFARFDFATVAMDEKQDPGLDVCCFNEVYQAIECQDSQKRNWTALVGTNLEPASYVLGDFDRDTIQHSELENSENNVAMDTPHCCLKYELEIKAGETKRVVIIVAGSLNSKREALKTYSYLQKNVDFLFEENEKYFTKFIEETVLIETPEPLLDKTFLWSKLTMKYLEQFTPGMGTGYHCSFPEWQNYFGRDVLIMLPGTIGVGDFEGARNQLEMYSRFQFPNGEIFHELSPTGTCIWHDTDSTPLFVADAAYYLQWTGDLNFLKSIYPSVKKAIEFLKSLDPLARNLIYVRGENSCWGSEATHPEEPQLLDQIYFYEALRGAAYIAAAMEDDEKAVEWDKKAEFIKRHRINSPFYYWSEKDKYFCKSPGEFEPGSLAIWASRGIVADAFDEEKATAVIDRLESDEFNTDLGFLMTSWSRTNFRPLLIWPWTSGIANFAEFKTHRTEQAILHLLNMIKMIVIKHYPGSAGDTLDGDTGSFINTWPIFAFHIGAVVLRPIIEGLFGVTPGIDEGNVTVDLHMPYNWPYIRLKNLRVGKCCLNVYAERSESDEDKIAVINKSEESIRVKIGFNYPQGTKIREVNHNAADGGGKAEFVVQETESDIHVYTEVEVPGLCTETLTIVREQIGPYIIESEYDVLDTALNEDISDSLCLKVQPMKVEAEKTILDAYAMGGTQHRVKLNYQFGKPEKVLVNGELTDFKYDQNKSLLDFSFSLTEGIQLKFDEYKTSADILLDEKWRFRTDPHDKGMKENWYAINYDDSRWQLKEPGGWEEGYEGLAWYRTRFKVPEELRGSKAFFILGGVNNHFQLYVKGKLMHSGRGYTPQIIDITNEVRQDEVTLAFRVEKTEGLHAGIRRPVDLLFETFREEKGWEKFDLRKPSPKGMFDWYRSKFYLPETFKGKILRLKFYPDEISQVGVSGSCWIYINGTLANIIGLSEKRVRQIYIHQYVKYGAENNIVIGVRQGNIGTSKVIPVQPVTIEIY